MKIRHQRIQPFLNTTRLTKLFECETPGEGQHDEPAESCHGWIINQYKYGRTRTAHLSRSWCLACAILVTHNSLPKLSVQKLDQKAKNRQAEAEIDAENTPIGNILAKRIPVNDERQHSKEGESKTERRKNVHKTVQLLSVLARVDESGARFSAAGHSWQLRDVREDKLVQTAARRPGMAIVQRLPFLAINNEVTAATVETLRPLD